MDIQQILHIPETEFKLTIHGTDDDPLFDVKEVATMLKISNITRTINKFDNEEKIMDENNKNKYLTFLGLFKLIFRSKNPIAEPFQKWICNVIKELRITGKYKFTK